MFEQPAPGEPHAIVKVRVVYHSRLPVSLSESIHLDEYVIALGSQAERSVGVPITRALRVPLRRSSWSFDTSFYHLVSQQQSYQATESYSCGTQSTGYGAYRSTTTRTCSRSVTRFRTVTRQVVDDVCHARVALAPLRNHVYIVQYEFFGSGRCAARCFEQVSTGPGTFRLGACTGS